MIGSLHRRLFVEERGTALTEFVITLPVFVTVFLGIVGLGRLQHAATAAHPEANRQMWEQAYESANSEPDTKWGDPTIGDYEQFERGDFDTLGYDQAKFMRLADYGTMGEAMNGATFEESVNWRFLREGRDAGADCDDCGREWVYANGLRQTAFTFAVTSDNRYSYGVPDVRWQIQPMADRINQDPPKSWLAYGAGTRYGIAVGQASRGVEWKRWEATFTPQYQVTAPSRTLETDDEAFVTVAAPRARAEGHDVYARIFGFEPSNHYIPQFQGRW